MENSHCTDILKFDEYFSKTRQGNSSLNKI